MNFSVGYQLLDDLSLVNTIIENKDKITEVYFSFGDFPNGRNDQKRCSFATREEAEERQIADLKRISESGISLNILFNATCYGADALSRSFFERIGNTVDGLSENLNIRSVTTTSPIIAKFIKSNFEGLKTRASVNMEIGSELGAEYLFDAFDGFYLKRELNRDLAAVKRLGKFYSENGKDLFGLANSGCLNFCSMHVFHDNLVAHEEEISKKDNGFVFRAGCAEFLKKKENARRIFDCTNFIRPEDVHYYEGLFTSMKLATRMNCDPVRVIESYVKRGAHRGSALELCEPNHASQLYPYVLENKYIKSEIRNERLVYTGIDDALIKLEDLC